MRGEVHARRRGEASCAESMSASCVWPCALQRRDRLLPGVVPAGNCCADDAREQHVRRVAEDLRAGDVERRR